MSEGIVLLHEVPSALLSHVEWTISGVSGAPVQLRWATSPQSNSAFRSVASFAGAADAGATLASAFMNLKQLTFEVIQYPSDQISGERWAFTPSLGMFHSRTDEAGNLVVNENQLRTAIEAAGSNHLKLLAEMRKLLGQAWDDQLEPLRELVGGSEGDHGVMSAEAERVAYGQNIRPI